MGKDRKVVYVPWLRIGRWDMLNVPRLKIGWDMFSVPRLRIGR